MSLNLGLSNLFWIVLPNDLCCCCLYWNTMRRDKNCVSAASLTVQTEIHTYIHACMHASIHTYIHTYMHTHMHACTHTHIHIHTSVWLDNALAGCQRDSAESINAGCLSAWLLVHNVMQREEKNYVSHSNAIVSTGSCMGRMLVAVFFRVRCDWFWDWLLPYLWWTCAVAAVCNLLLIRTLGSN
jgi:hypothetical protein